MYLLYHIIFSVCSFTLTHSVLFTLFIASVSCTFFPSFTLFGSILCEHFKGFMLDFSLPFPDWCFPFQLTESKPIQAPSHCVSAVAMCHMLCLFSIFSPFVLPFLTCKCLVSSKTPTFGCSLHFCCAVPECFCFPHHLP